MICEATSEEYRRQSQALLPSGPAWPREPDSNLAVLLGALAAELAAVHNRACMLAREANPLTTAEMLGDWETVAGLPDDCMPAGSSTAERRAALIAKLNTIGGQSAAYYVALAAAFGWEIEVSEYRQFRAGVSVAGESLTNGDWVFAWRVAAETQTVRVFQAGYSVAGDPLASWGNAPLQCLLTRWKPAHTLIIFDFSENFEPVLF